MENKILVPFAPILVESTRSIGYSFEAALSDVIDNSISAKAKNVWIDFELKSIPFLMIIDDGIGMNKSELETAMTYGSQSSQNKRDDMDLGRFGLGLKMASMSQCKSLTVITKKNNEINGATWDLDHIREQGNWVLKIYNSFEVKQNFNSKCERLDTLTNGTIVLWENFDRVANSTADIKKSLEKKLDYARDHVSLVFHRYIGKEDSKHSINIFFNNLKLDVFDPFMEKHDKCQKFPEENIKLSGKVIKVKSYILPNDSLISHKDRDKKQGIGNIKLNQGFYIYRNMRLIIWGTWYRMSVQNELFKLARIKVDIPNSLDHIWDIDIKKSQAVLPDMVKNELAIIVSKAINDSKKTIKFRGKKLDDENTDRYWETISINEGFKYLINKNNSVLLDILINLDEKTKNKINIYLEMVEENFPFHEAYIHTAENKIIYNDSNEDIAYKRAHDIFNSLDICVEDKIQFLEKLKKDEYFCKYPNIFEKLRKEINE